jgi:hypothetical protein
MTSSFLSVYEEGCRVAHVEPNSALSNYFAASNSAEPLHVLSLSTNLVGPRGLQALLPVWQLCSHTLHTLDFSHNNLDSGAIRRLARWLMTSSDAGFPALRRLELRGNPFSFQSGKCLVHFCEGVRPCVRDVADTGEVAQRVGEKATSGIGMTAAATVIAPCAARDTTSTCYWEEVSWMHVDYVGVEDTLMSPALQRALGERIAAAIARREQRRRLSRRKSLNHAVPPPQQPRSSVVHSTDHHGGGNEADAASGAPHDSPLETQPGKREESDVAPSNIRADLLAALDDVADENVQHSATEGALADVGSTRLPDGADGTEDGNSGGDGKPDDTHSTASSEKTQNDEMAENAPAVLPALGVSGHGACQSHVPTRSFASQSDDSRGASEKVMSYVDTSANASRSDPAHAALPPPSMEGVNVSDNGATGSVAVAGDVGNEALGLHSVHDTATQEEEAVQAFTAEQLSPLHDAADVAATASTKYDERVPSPLLPLSPPPMKTALDILDELGLEAAAGAADGGAEAPPSWLDEL